MKKSNMELMVGGSILVALFVLISGVLWLKQVNITRGRVNYAVLLPDVGTLQLGDPVMINGVKKGQVTKMFLRSPWVVVMMHLDKDVTLTDSSTVTVQNIGLLGERMVGIRLSEKGTPYPPVRGRDTTWIRGYFDTGIAEAMGMLGHVLDGVLRVLDRIENMVNSTIGDTLFIQRFNDIMARLDTVSATTGGLLTDSRADIERSIRNVRVVSEDVRTLLNTNAGQVDAMIDNGARITERARLIVDRIDTVTVAVQAIMDRIEKGEGTLGLMMKDEEFYPDLKASLATMDTLMHQIQDEGLKLRIRLGFGKKKK